MGDFLTDPEDGAEGLVTELELELPELPAEGTYDNVVVTTATFGKSKSSGKPQIILSLSAPEDGISSRYYITFMASTLWRVRKDFDALGVEMPKPGAGIKVKPEDFIGKKVRARLAHETYNGRTSAKFVELFAPYEGAGTRAFDPGTSGGDVPF
jgi:hypothetical protein